MANRTKKATKSNSAAKRPTGLVDSRTSEANGEHPSVDEQIRLRAHELYMERGAQPDDDLRDWLQAERELSEGAAAEAPSAAAR